MIIPYTILDAIRLGIFKVIVKPEYLGWYPRKRNILYRERIINDIFLSLYINYIFFKNGKFLLHVNLWYYPVTLRCIAGATST